MYRIHVHWPFKCLSLECEFKSNKNHMSVCLTSSVYLFWILKRVMLFLLDNLINAVARISQRLIFKFRTLNNKDTAEFPGELQRHLDSGEYLQYE